MQIDDAIDAVIVFLQRHELADRAEIVAEMEIACRLDAGKTSGLKSDIVSSFGLVEGPASVAVGGLMHIGAAAIKRHAVQPGG